MSAGEIINTVTERNETIDHRIHDYINKYNENVTIHVQSRNIENRNGHETVKKTTITTNSRQKKSLGNNHRRPRRNNVSRFNRVDNNSFNKGKKQQQQKVGFSPFTTPKPKKRFVHTPSPSFQRKGHTYLKKGSSTKQKLQPKVRCHSFHFIA